MGSLTDYAAAELLDHIFNAAYTPAETLYLALCTADPTDAATGAAMNEVADAGSYARTAITFGAASARRVTQDADVTFPQATVAWGTVTHWAIVDSNTHGAGNVLAHGALGAQKEVNANNTPTVSSGEIYVEISAGEISDYLAAKLLDLMFNNTAYAQPDTYVALLTVAGADDQTGSTISEPSGGSYARVQVNPNGGDSPTWNLATAGLVDNAAAIEFATATAAWGTVVGVALVDAAAAGNLLGYDNALGDQAVGDGDTVSFPIGDLDIQLS